MSGPERPVGVETAMSAGPALSAPAQFSVVIPAHQEERSIGRCLHALAPLVEAAAAEVVVVVNGSTDRTARTARSHVGVRVVETAVPSKANALNLGDAYANVFPRVYLDADVTVSSGGLAALAAALSVVEPRVGSLALRIDRDECTWPVRAFYEIFVRLPYASTGLVGLGMYGLSEAGRARFDEFPDHTADDLFVDRLFAPHERIVLTEHHFVVRAPRTTKDLLAVRTRVHFGNRELAAEAPGDVRFASSSGTSLRALQELVLGTPQLLPQALVYCAVTLAARARAAVRVRTGRRVWDRDTSTH